MKCSFNEFIAQMIQPHDPSYKFELIKPRPISVHDKPLTDEDINRIYCYPVQFARRIRE